MGGQAVRWTAEQVMALAPDDASRRAGNKLAPPGPWTEAGWGDGAVWGQCKGSGSKPYQTVVDLDGGQGPGYRCSCPSRKFPCKHALGLLLLWAGGETTVAEGGGPPEWADGWLGDRRRRAERKAGRAPAGAPDGAEAEPAAGTGQGADDEARAEAAHRRAAQRAERITAGAQELEQRLADLLRGGLAGAEQRGYAPWEEMAARMVDAQAPGLAARIRELGAIPGSGEGWPGRLLAECALLHLLVGGWRRAAELPAPLADTVRTRVGLTLEAADLLAEKQARVRDEWLVLAQRDAEEGRLTVRRVWLYGRTVERHALLLSYGAGGRAPELALPVGSVLDAELAYYPGSGSLRAALGQRYGAPLPGFQPPGAGVREALEDYAGTLREDPWAESRPCVLEGVLPVPPSATETADGTAGSGQSGRAGQGAAGWQLAAMDEESALPVAPGTGAAALWRLLALSAEGPVTVFGECGHRGFAPHTAWHEGRAVPL
ncbi:SWIM zinc finger family protein [Streptomyces sp. WMMB303]|uniref:SWIM zinc finger family protein n=1 Tax=Streptomyces sp. WMMB303 TaxID=3034154 RepID=UPI0023ECEDAB|nr:SWIM zinc finger family protein [Streptomyces sp. WMMB303]MDF4253875.1 SWIM zinc finger family protein [Streptomyces sp. WMMB303]